MGDSPRLLFQDKSGFVNKHNNLFINDRYKSTFHQ